MGGTHLAYSVEVFEARGYLLVRHHGATNVRELDEIRARVRELAQASGLTDTLIDARELSTLPSRADFFFAIDRAARDRQTGRAALLVSEPQRQTAEFIVLAATNRGIDLQAFTAEADALAWLLTRDR